MNNTLSKESRKAMCHANLDVIETADNIISSLESDLSAPIYQIGYRATIGCAFVAGVAEGKRRERARRRKEIEDMAEFLQKSNLSTAAKQKCLEYAQTLKKGDQI